jgi:uncharacterized membrane protein
MPGGFELSFLQMGLVAAIVFYALAIPGDFHYKLTALGFGVCHQIDSHSFHIAGHQMPLCARCSGIYLAALAGLGMLVVLRRRSARLPMPQMIAILGIFFAAMVADGVNSTMQSFNMGVWDSSNILRLLTGSLAGLTVAFVFYPMFNLSLWHREVRKRESVLDTPLELVGYMVAAGLLVALVLDGGDWLYYPLSILSIIGMLALLTMANTMLVLMLTRREATARTFTDALTPLLFGFLVALIELTLLAWGRASLAPYMAASPIPGLPLVPGLP